MCVCRDAGAANALAAFALAVDPAGAQVLSVCVGPARDAYRAAGTTPWLSSAAELDRGAVDDLLDRARPAAVLLGTSLDSSTERTFLLAARDRGVRSVGVVDWWSNFGQRFSSPRTVDLAYLPDAVAVPDEDARRGCVQDGVPDTLIHVVGNPYWDRLARLSAAFRSAARRKARAALGVDARARVVLVVSSDIRNLDLALGYDELDFWRAVGPLPSRTAAGRPVVWAVKPHPREPVEDLVAMLRAHGVGALVVEGMAGIDAVLASDGAVGMCSSLLFEAALVGRPVVSLQPGMDADRLRHLRIFDHLRITTGTDAGAASHLVRLLLDGPLRRPDMAGLPAPIGDGRAAARLQGLLSTDRSM